MGLSGRLQGPQHMRPWMTASGGSWGLCHPGHEAELPAPSPPWGASKRLHVGRFYRKGEERDWKENG